MIAAESEVELSFKKDDLILFLGEVRVVCLIFTIVYDSFNKNISANVPAILLFTITFQLIDDGIDN